MSALQLAWPEWRRRLVFWLGAIVTGAVAVLFAWASDRLLALQVSAAAASPLWFWLAPPLSLALVAWLTRRFFVGAQGSGIPQTIAALSLASEEARNRLLSLRIASGKLLLTLLALLGGASIGREGPTVQIGASIMHSLNPFAKFRSIDVDRGLILAGGAAGIAAAFNTPLAGVVFAIEELSRSFEERTSGNILTAVILAGVTSMALLGNYTYFGATNAVLSGPRMWLAVPVCGVVGGLAGGVFARLLLALRDGLPGRVGRLQRNWPVVFAFLCGGVLAVIGWLSHSATFGTGYPQARGVILQQATPMQGFVVLKALATLTSYVAGIPGGIFAPSLAVGAALGGEIAPWLPVAPAGIVALLTMAAYFSGVVQAPLTALVIVGEMTGNRGLTLPLMAVVLLGRVASASVCRRSLYRGLAERFIPAGERESGIT
jgi:H+/Cl- antiporter ClcA